VGVIESCGTPVLVADEDCGVCMADDKERQNTAGESAEIETKDAVELNAEGTETVDFVLGLAA
jgi:hypothetical protein